MTAIKLFCISLILFTCQLLAQTIIHKSISVDDGLVDNTVSSIFQDSKGFIWFGTYNGLSRWDGKNFYNFTRSNGLPHVAVFDIVESPDSTLYFAIFGGGVLALKNGVLDTIDRKDGLYSNFVSNIFLQEDGSLLISNGGGLNAYKNGKITVWNKQISPTREFHITGFLKDKKGTTYIATSSKGLISIKNNKIRKYTVADGLLTDKISSIKLQNDSTLLIGTRRGINKLRNGKITSLKYKGKDLDVYVYNILIGKTGIVYYTATDGIVVEKKNSIEFIGKENGLVYSSVLSILEDQNGTIYFGTDGLGVSIYYPDKIETYTDKYILPNMLVSSVYQDSKGIYYFATNSGMVINDGKRLQRITTANGLRGDEIKWFYETSDGKIYISAYLHNLCYYKNNRIVKYPKIAWRNQNDATSIAETKTGELIVGTRYGAYLLKDNNVKLITKKDGLNNNFIKSLLVTKDSSIIYGTHGNGLTIYKNGKYKYLTAKDGLSNGVINVLFQNTNGDIWIGTDIGGINIWNGNTIDTIDVTDGLTSNRIKDITADDNGKIYISTPKGVNIVENYAREIFIRTLTTNDGLVSNDCTLHGTIKDQDGIIWISTNKGVSKYNPAADKMISAPPKIYITGTEIFNEEYPIKKLKKEKELNYNQNYIKFIYTGINLSAPEKILYKYRLEGIDNKWIETKRNWVQYTSLDAGNYSFEVKARNEWGFWSNPAKLEFTIKPLWWKTWWSRVIAGFIFILGIYFTVNRRIARLEKERNTEKEFSRRLIESGEKERERIAAGLHDSLGQNLLVIKNRALLGLKSKKKEAPLEQLSEISNAVSLAIDEVRQIAYNLHPYQLKRLGLSKAISSIITNIKDSTKIVFEKKIDNIDNLFSPENELHIYRIVQEIINNIVKHSGADKATVTIEKQNDIVTIKITDNGRGFKLKEIRKKHNKVGGFGFENIFKRLSLLNGKMKINSANGTVIEINILL